MVIRVGIFWQAQVLARSIVAVGIVGLVGMPRMMILEVTIVGLVRMVVSTEVSLERHVVLVLVAGVGVGQDGVYKGPTDEGT